MKPVAKLYVLMESNDAQLSKGFSSKVKVYSLWLIQYTFCKMHQIAPPGRPHCLFYVCTKETDQAKLKVLPPDVLCGRVSNGQSMCPVDVLRVVLFWKCKCWPTHAFPDVNTSACKRER